MTRRKRQDTPFRHQLTALMGEHGMTVRKAATIAKVAPATIVDWRAGGSPADFTAVQRLAEIFGVSLAYLLTGKDDSRPKDSPANVTEVFTDGGMLFDGYAEIKIRRLVPRVAGKSSRKKTNVRNTEGGETE